MINHQDSLLRGITLGVALLLVGLGIWLILEPKAIETLYPISLNAPMAVSEIRAVFGGLMAGIGGALLLLDLVYKRRRDAAMVLATVMGGLFLARIVGFGVEGFPSGPVLNESIFEIVTFVVLVALGAYRPNS